MGWRSRLPLGGLLGVLGALACEGQLSVPEPPPVADPGFDQVRYLNDAEGLTVALDARASCDPMGTPLTGAAWEIVSAPGTTPELSATTLLRAEFVASDPGEYVLSLTVAANDRESDPEYITILVKPGVGEDVVVTPPSTTACGDPLSDA